MSSLNNINDLYRYYFLLKAIGKFLKIRSIEVRFIARWSFDISFNGGQSTDDVYQTIILTKRYNSYTILL